MQRLQDRIYEIYDYYCGVFDVHDDTRNSNKNITVDDESSFMKIRVDRTFILKNIFQKIDVFSNEHISDIGWAAIRRLYHKRAKDVRVLLKRNTLRAV